MTTSSKATAGEPAPDAFDESDLRALDEAIAQVLASEADRNALHRHIDAKVRLDRTLWNKGIQLGWPAIGLPVADLLVAAHQARRP